MLVDCVLIARITSNDSEQERNDKRNYMKKQAFLLNKWRGYFFTSSCLVPRTIADPSCLHLDKSLPTGRF